MYQTVNQPALWYPVTRLYTAVWPYQTCGWADVEPLGTLWAAALLNHPSGVECPLGNSRFEPRGWGWHPDKERAAYSYLYKLHCCVNFPTREHTVHYMSRICYYNTHFCVFQSPPNMEVKGFLDMSSREAPEVNTDVTSEHLTQFAFFQAAEGLKAFTVTLNLKSFGHKYGNIYVEEAAVNIMNAANHSIPTFSRGSCSEEKHAIHCKQQSSGAAVYSNTENSDLAVVTPWLHMWFHYAVLLKTNTYLYNPFKHVS